jgi:hypothetical protein
MNPGERPAVYAVSLVMGANGSQTDTFSVPAGEDFYVSELTHKKTGACDIDKIEAPTENVVNEGVPVELLAGDAVRRLPLAGFLFVAGGSTVTVKATDRSGAGNTLNLVFLGVLRRHGV